MHRGISEVRPIMKFFIHKFQLILGHALISVKFFRQLNAFSSKFDLGGGVIEIIVQNAQNWRNILQIIFQ